MEVGIRRKLFTSILLFLHICPAQPIPNITIAYPNGSSNWPLFIAAEGGYYRKYGLNVSLTFSSHPAGIALLVSDHAQALHYSLGQMMEAASKDGSFVLVSSLLNRGTFALMAWRDNQTIQDLKGKRIGIGQLGDANYGYSAALLAKAGLSARDVEWVPFGPTAAARTAALLSHRVDAALLTAPAYFKLEGSNIKVLANCIDRDDVYASTVLIMSKRIATRDPDLVRRIIKAHAESVKRFYEDKQFAVKAFMKYDETAAQADLDRLYDLYGEHQLFERIPFVLAEAVTATMNQEADPQIAGRLKAFDFHQVIDNSAVDKLIREGFFEKLFGPEIRWEEQKRARLVFGGQ
jgi:ABC-type nitrate/sulfonate/bicarbonate transport system substrate-binding protein